MVEKQPPVDALVFVRGLPVDFSIVGRPGGHIEALRVDDLFIENAGFCLGIFTDTAYIGILRGGALTLRARADFGVKMIYSHMVVAVAVVVSLRLLLPAAGAHGF